VDTCFPRGNSFLPSSFVKSSKEASWLNQKQIEAAAVLMRLFLSGLAFNFDANFHELEEVTKRALLEIETEASS
jgi:hypothetical protein